MARILVVAPNWIGDALMAQPLLMRLRTRNPGARVDVLAPPWVAPVARRMPEVDEVLEADLRHGELQLGDRWRLGRQLKERGYSQAYVLPNTMKSALAPSFAGITLRAGYLGESRVGLLNRIHKARPSGEPMAVHYARLAERPGDEPELPLPVPSLSFSEESAKATAARFGISGPYTVFCPGAEYGPAKRWPFFGQLAAQLGTQIVLLGSPGDLKDSKDIAGTNLIGKTTLDEAIDLIAGAAAVVTNDSGLMHVAAACGTPQVALFGSSSPESTPPQSAAARIVWLQVECSPCFQRVCPLGHFKCMNGIAVERVLEELQALPSSRT
ncbi:MAG: lipopolysaccharide heptosyltransferase II [Betaproteobacteria bacterium]